jgi:hypothetical protein
MGRSAYDPAHAMVDNGGMDDRALHRIDDCLSEDWVDSWAAGVIVEIEAYLAKHAAFDAYLDEQNFADAA